MYLHLNELPFGKAIGRALNRYLATGRFIDPKNLYGYGDKPSAVYDELIKQEGLVNGYSKYSNDVDFGQPPIRIGGTEDLSDHGGNAGSGGGLFAESVRNAGEVGSGTGSQGSDRANQALTQQADEAEVTPETVDMTDDVVQQEVEAMKKQTDTIYEKWRNVSMNDASAKKLLNVVLNTSAPQKCGRIIIPVSARM